MQRAIMDNLLGAWDGLLHKAGISPPVYRVLMQSCLLMDFRSQPFARVTRTSATDMFSPLFWVVGQYLLISIITCVFLFRRVDSYFYALVNLGVSLAVMVASLIVEFHEIVIDPDDLRVIGHHPVPPRTYAAARLSNLLGYVLLMSLALNLVPAITGVGLVDARWTFLPAYLLAATLESIVAAGLVILIYAVVVSKTPAEQTQDVLAWTQVILILILFYAGWFLVIRDHSNSLEMMSYRLPEWVHYLPVAWLAGFVDSAGAGPVWWLPLLGFAAVAVVLAGLVIRTLSRAYTSLEIERSVWGSRGVASLPRPGSLLGRTSARTFFSKEEAVFFWLGKTMLTRDSHLKMSCWPQLATVGVVALLGVLTKQLNDPWVVADHSSVLSYVCVYLLAYPMPLIVWNLHYSRNAEASWALHVAPVPSYRPVAQGLLKAVLWRIYLPVLVLLLAVFALNWGNLWHAVIHVAAGVLISVAAGYASMIAVFRHMPFSRPIAKGGMLGSVAAFASVLTGIAMGLGLLHRYAIQSGAALGLYLVLLVALAYLLKVWAWSAVSRLRILTC